MQPGDVIDGRFELLQAAGRGGMGTVFRAHDLKHSTRVAVKVVDGASPESLGRFEREARLLESLSHPGIVRYVAYGRTQEGAPYLAMEWLDGDTLDDLLRRKGTLALTDVLALARAVASALQAAHASGVVHRDLKPSNLMLVQGDPAATKLLDFGIARAAGETDLTLSGMLVGTPYYMSPEQARGDRAIGVSSDLFSLGSVLFECLAGRRAFDGAHPMAVLSKILFAPTPVASTWRADVPAALDALCCRLLARERDQRVSSAAELLAALDDLASASLPKLDALAQGLTIQERRFVTVVAASFEAATTLDQSRPRSLGSGPPEPWQRLQREVRRHGGRLERLVDGSLVALLDRGEPVAQAARAARCALAIRASCGGVPMVLCTGRAELGGYAPIGDVIERAVTLLGDVPSDRIRLDPLTAGLLPTRFEVAGDRGGLWLGAERDMDEAVRTVRGRVTPFVGREREIALLDARLAACQRSRAPAAVLVLAPPGAGKSRLRHELVRRLAARPNPPEVLNARGDPLGLESAWGMIASALRRWAGVRADEPSAAQHVKLGARMTRHVPAELQELVTAYLGEMTDTLVDAPSPIEARSDAREAADRVRRAWLAWLEAECRVRPLFLVLEDLQWADRPSVQLIEAALCGLEGSPFFVVALARPEVDERFPELWKPHPVERLVLGPLERPACDALVRAVRGNTNAAAVERAFKRSQGNPFFLEELLRGEDDSVVPDTVLGMVESRLAALSEYARRALRAASIFGTHCWVGALTTLLDRDQATTVASLRELVAAELLWHDADTRVAGEEQYRFRHDLVREAAYATLTQADCELGHRLAAAWLEARSWPDARVVAQHFMLGQDPAAALPHLLRAANEAVEGNDFAAALGRCEEAVACGATGESLGLLRLLQVEAYHWRGANADAMRASQESAALLPRGSGPWFRAVGYQAQIAAQLADNEVALDVERQLLAEPATSVETAEARARALCQAAEAHLAAGRHQSASELLRAADQTVAQLADPGPTVQGSLCLVKAFHDLHEGRLGAAVKHYATGAAAFAKTGALRREWRCRVNLGFTYLELGAYEEAERVLREALHVARQLSMPGLLAVARHNLGLVMAHRGRIDEGLREERLAYDTFMAQPELRMAAACLCYLARMLAMAGRGEDAETEARACLELSGPYLTTRGEALGALGRAYLLQRRGTEALEATSQGMRILESLGGVVSGESYLRLAHVEALSATGQTAGAARAIADARQRLLARAMRVDDTALRVCFLTRDPDNRRTLELAERMAGEG